MKEKQIHEIRFYLHSGGKNKCLSAWINSYTFINLSLSPTENFERLGGGDLWRNPKLTILTLLCSSSMHLLITGLIQGPPVKQTGHFPWRWKGKHDPVVWMSSLSYIVSLVPSTCRWETGFRTKKVPQLAVK